MPSQHNITETTSAPDAATGGRGACPRGDLTIPATAALLSISARQVHRLIRERTLHAYHIGKRGIRIRHDSVEALRARSV